MARSDNSAAGRPGARDLTTGPIFATLIAFALPTLGSSVLQSLNGSINAIWVGRFLGEAALTATANANLVMFLMLGTVFGFGMAATILVGQAIGRGDVDGARRAVGAAAFWFALISATSGVLGWVFAPDILGLMNTPAAAVGLAVSYLRVIFLAVPAMFFLSFLMMAQRGAGDARTPLYFMGVSVVLDVVLNPVLILGLGPFPALGISGSAAATLIAQVTALIAMVVFLYRTDKPLRLRGEELRYIRPSRALSKSILVKGLPMGLQLFVVSGSALVMIGFVNGYGVATAAAYGVSAQLWSYIQMPAMALGAAASAMAAQNIGAGKWERVEAVTRSGILANLLLTGALVALLYAVDRQALALFLGTDSAAIPIAAHLNIIVSWGFILFGVTMVVFGTVRSTGAVVPPLIILVVSLVGVRIGFATLMQPGWGADAVWWSYPISSATSTTLALLYHRFGGWRRASMGVGRVEAEAEERGYGRNRSSDRAPDTDAGVTAGLAADCPSPFSPSLSKAVCGKLPDCPHLCKTSRYQAATGL